MSADDGHVNTPRGLPIGEIALGPQMLSNSARNGPESAKIVSVDYRHVNAPRGSLSLEITSGLENGE